MKKLIAANWKMNPATPQEAIALFEGTINAAQHIDADVVICPPFQYLGLVMDKDRGAVTLGAQDVFWEPTTGAFTGEVSAEMLSGEHVQYVIIGHSERRTILKETDEIIKKKIHAAFTERLNVILCVGEPLEIRELGMNVAEEFVLSQLDKDLEGIKIRDEQTLVIAYEPIWAIGSGKPETPENSAVMIRKIKEFIREHWNISVRVLYGGSVKANNAEDILSQPDIDGALVGGASLNVDEFAGILKATS
jgi:triosephosphate isomerase